MIQYLHFQNVLIFWSLVFAVLNQKALFLFFFVKNETASKSYVQER